MGLPCLYRLISWRTIHSGIYMFYLTRKLREQTNYSPCLNYVHILLTNITIHSFYCNCASTVASTTLAIQIYFTKPIAASTSTGRNGNGTYICMTIFDRMGVCRRVTSSFLNATRVSDSLKRQVYKSKCLKFIICHDTMFCIQHTPPVYLVNIHTLVISLVWPVHLWHCIPCFQSNKTTDCHMKKQNLIIPTV